MSLTTWPLFLQPLFHSFSESLIVLFNSNFCICQVLLLSTIVLRRCQHPTPIPRSLKPLLLAILLVYFIIYIYKYYKFIFPNEISITLKFPKCPSFQVPWYQSVLIFCIIKYHCYLPHCDRSWTHDSRALTVFFKNTVFFLIIYFFLYIIRIIICFHTD